MTHATTRFEANGRSYDPPDRPVAALCLDGSADEYLTTSLARKRMPRLEAMLRRGHRSLVRGALPSFTNVNNCAIVTGCPPSVTGIGGNFFLDPETGEEVMMNSSKYLRAPTILAAAARAGRRVAMVTAKDKLRELLSAELIGDDRVGMAFSAERAQEVTKAVHGIEGVEAMLGPAPPIYSAEASLYVLRAGVALVERGLADFLYLSLTDYMQHRYAPEDEESLDFYAAMDHELGRLIDLGVLVAATADHGMNSKSRPDGSPRALWLETRLEERFGPGYQVICPITDPYVVHHGALGSAVTVHLPEGADASAVARFILELDEVTEVHDREMAALKLELPADRIGDLFVLSTRDAVIGRRPELHDLSKLEGRLRSHGGRYEEMVPLLISEALTPEYLERSRGDARNFEIFDYLLNGTRSQ